MRTSERVSSTTSSASILRRTCDSAVTAEAGRLFQREREDDRVEPDHAMLFPGDVEVVPFHLFGVLLEGHHRADRRHVPEGIGEPFGQCPRTSAGGSAMSRTRRLMPYTWNWISDIDPSDGGFLRYYHKRWVATGPGAGSAKCLITPQFRAVPPARRHARSPPSCPRAAPARRPRRHTCCGHWSGAVRPRRRTRGTCPGPPAVVRAGPGSPERRARSGGPAAP